MSKDKEKMEGLSSPSKLVYLSLALHHVFEFKGDMIPVDYIIISEEVRDILGGEFDALDSWFSYLLNEEDTVRKGILPGKGKVCYERSNLILFINALIRKETQELGRRYVVRKATLPEKENK